VSLTHGTVYEIFREEPGKGKNKGKSQNQGKSQGKGKKG